MNARAWVLLLILIALVISVSIKPSEPQRNIEAQRLFDLNQKVAP